LHIDAGPYSKRLSCICISWSSLLSDGSEKVTKYLISSYLKADGSSHHAVWPPIIADFDAMASGYVGGRCIAGEGRKVWKLILIITKTDEQERCDGFGLPHYNGPEPCAECLANRDDMPYTDLQPGAAWRPTTNMALTKYMSRIRVPKHPLAASHYCCDRWFFYRDLMHLMDCNGVTASTLGGLLGMMMRDPAIGPNRAARLAIINTEREAWYTDNPGDHRLPPILSKNLVAEGWGELHGPAIKAANTRAAVPFVHALCHKYQATASAEHRAALRLITALRDFYDTLYGQPLFVSDAALATLRACTDDFGLAYQELREWARTRRLLFFNVRPKTHGMMHVPEYAAVLNPRWVQNYSEESLIGSTCAIWKRSARGRYHAGIQRTVLVKRATGLFLRLEM